MKCKINKTIFLYLTLLPFLCQNKRLVERCMIKLDEIEKPIVNNVHFSPLIGYPVEVPPFEISYWIMHVGMISFDFKRNIATYEDHPYIKNVDHVYSIDGCTVEDARNAMSYINSNTELPYKEYLSKASYLMNFSNRIRGRIRKIILVRKGKRMTVNIPVDEKEK